MKAELQDSSDPATEHSLQSRRGLDRDFAKGVLWTGAGKWLIQLVSWPVTIVTANLLVPGDYGYVALVGVVLRFAQIFTEAGIGSAIVSGLAIDEHQLRQLNFVGLALGVAGFLGTALMSWPVSWFYHDASLQPVLFALAFALLIEGVALVPAAVIRRRFDFKQLAFCEAARNIADISVTLLLAFLGARYWSLIFGYLAGVLTWLLLIWKAEAVGFARPNRSRLTEVLSFSKHLLSRNAANFVATGSDSVIGGLTVGKAGLGHYSFGLSIAWAPAEKITQLIVRVAPAIFGRVRDDRPALARYFLWVTAIITMIAYPMFAGIAIVADDLIPLLLGDNWRGLMPFILPLCLGGMAAETMSLAPHLLVAVGETRVLARNGIAAMLIAPVLFYALSAGWGAVGLAVAWAVGASVLGFPLLIVACRKVGVSTREFIRSIISPFAATLIMAGCLIVLKRSVFLEMSVFWRLVATALVGCLVYILSLALLDGKRVRALVMFGLELRSNPEKIESIPV
jgi:O-antigen/teichoic acid export membrane protein